MRQKDTMRQKDHPNLLRGRKSSPGKLGATLSVRIPPDWKPRIDEAARADGLSINAFVRELVGRAIGEQPPAPKVDGRAVG